MTAHDLHQTTSACLTIPTISRPNLSAGKTLTQLIFDGDTDHICRKTAVIAAVS